VTVQGTDGPEARCQCIGSSGGASEVVLAGERERGQPRQPTRESEVNHGALTTTTTTTTTMTRTLLKLTTSDDANNADGDDENTTTFDDDNGNTIIIIVATAPIADSNSTAIIRRWRRLSLPKSSMHKTMAI
jgi:hypothetical protein